MADTKDPVVTWKISARDLQLIREALVQLRRRYQDITFQDGESKPELNFQIINNNPREGILRVGYLLEKIGMK